VGADRRLLTLGQPAALAAVEAMLGSHVPHAILLVGPAGVGKTTLALDLAAALLCVDPDPAARPCRACRACRAVAHGNHPDLHRLAPGGAGSVIPIGGREDRGIRDLVAELAFLPVEGGARVAVVEAADRMTEDAQSAFLKTLEEPPRDVTLILCASDEERLLPTIRSRCVRLRLGPVPRRDVETIVRERGLADAPEAARAARLADGRPGVALAYAASPEAVRLRSEIARTLLDLASRGRTDRLIGIRDLAGRASELSKAIRDGAARAAAAAGSDGAGATGAPTSGRGRGRGRTARGRASAVDDGAGASADGTSGASDEGASTQVPEETAGGDGRAVRIPAAERRAAALALVAVWRDLLRDLAAVVGRDPRLVRDTDLLDDLTLVAPGFDEAAIGQALARLDVAGERLEGNVSPEIVLDVLALRHRASPTRA